MKKALIINIIIGAWFVYEILLGSNPFKSAGYDVRLLLRSSSLFFAYLFFATVPFLFYPKALNRFLKYFLISLPITIFVFFGLTTGGDFVQPQYEIARILALLYVPLSIYVIMNDRKTVDNQI